MNLAIEIHQGLKGNKTVPGDKSISHRALMIGAIGDGKTEITSCSNAADPMSTLSCIKQLGVDIEEKNNIIIIHGKGKYGLSKPNNPLNAGNSGTTIRLLSGILAGQKFESTILGDESLCSRPMKRILDPLRQMGAKINGTEKNTAPLNIFPANNLKAINYVLPVASAQVKSAVLFAGLFAEGTTSVIENVLSRDHTERMLGIKTKFENGKFIAESSSELKINGKKFFVPGDISAATFLITAALIVPNSSITITNVGLNPTRTKVLEVYKSMGANISIENQRIVEGEPIGDIIAKTSNITSNITLQGKDIVDLIDEIPILAVTAMFANGTFTIRDAKELRAKETDRISALVNNLKLLGVDVEEYEDGFSFTAKNNYKGCIIPSYNDHRIAMSFGVAGLRINNITIDNAECANISFPNFWKELFV